MPGQTLLSLGAFIIEFLNTSTHKRLPDSPEASKGIIVMKPQSISITQSNACNLKNHKTQKPKRPKCPLPIAHRPLPHALSVEQCELDFVNFGMPDT
ncbi:hypothetical protein ACLKA6_006974 [Drosophila palustris]